MPKLKTKSSVKKRFRLTGTGKVVRSYGYKQHGMRKRNSRMLRQARGTTLLSEADSPMIRRHMPYA